MKRTLVILSLLVSAPALAHTGHLSNESLHGLLHVEHLIMIAVIGFIAYIAKVLFRK